MTNAQLEVKDFRLFLAVAEELHFGRAASRLRIAQPNLSQHIKRLEERLGLQLLERTTRLVSLTPAGELFFERSRFLLTQVDSLATQTQQVASGQKGSISIGFTPTVAFDVLPAILERFRTLYPDVVLSLSETSTSDQVQKLVQGVLNFGFLRLPIHTRRLETLTVGHEQLVAVLPRRHRLSSRTSLMLEDLAEEDFVFFSPIAGVGFQDHAFSYCQRAGFTPRLKVPASDTGSILAFVAAGFGIAILPDYVGHILHPRVTFQRLQEIPPVAHTAMAWSSEVPSSVFDAFRKVAGKVIGDSATTRLHLPDHDFFPGR